MKKYYSSDFMYSVRAFFSPGCWIRNRRTCRKWDNKLRDLLKNPVFTDTDYDTYTVKINGVEIWVSNYPYCYGYVYKGGLAMSVACLPKRSTAIMLRDALYADRCA